MATLSGRTVGLWTSGSILLALVYGIQFDLNDEERSGSSSKPSFISIGATSLAARWLVSVALANVQDFFLNRPVIILLRSCMATNCPRSCQCCA